jgi:3-oxoacyl-[acyl-carrier-protein] synthase-3
MAFLSIPNVAIKGMSACVPSCIEENKDVPLYTPEEAEKVIETTGVERKHIVTDSQTASDLCFRACEELLEKLSWERDSIDLICNVTQTSDYINHPNVFVLHDKLGLKNDCMSLDLYHGCPGWVVGLSTVASLMSHGSIKRALLLDGDNISSLQYGQDREGRPLFGDCGTATALEYDESASPMYFQTGTNSKDGEALIRKKGGFRQPYTLEEYQQEIGMRSGELSTDGIEDLMDGMSVFSFGISTPPKSIKQLCEHFGLSLDKVDKLVLHQANKFMVQKIAKKLKVELDRVPFSLRDYGNTTSASIPLTIVSQCANDYSTSPMKTLACGFGTGLSWASVYFETSGVVCPEVVEI